MTNTLKNNRLKPFANLIKLIPDEVESTSKGGIIIPDSVKDTKKRITGVIVDWGKAVKAARLKKVGCRILFGEYSGFTRCEDEQGEPLQSGIPYRYISEDDVCGVFEEGGNE